MGLTSTKVEEFEDAEPLSPARFGPYQDTIRDFWRKDVDPEKPWMLGNIHWSTETDGDGIGFEKKVVTFFRLKVNSLDPRERLQRERLGSWFHFGTEFVLGYLTDH